MGYYDFYPQGVESYLDKLLLSALNIDDLGAGKHILDGKEINIESSWVAYIRPSFEMPTALCVIHEDTRVFGAFTFLENPSQNNGESVYASLRTDFPPGWKDEVKHTLQRFNLFARPWGFALDGTKYIVQVNTRAGNASIELSNPTAPSFTAFEASLFHVARDMANITGHQRQVLTLERWKEYLRNQK